MNLFSKSQDGYPKQKDLLEPINSTSDSNQICVIADAPKRVGDDEVDYIVKKKVKKALTKIYICRGGTEKCTDAGKNSKTCPLPKRFSESDSKDKSLKKKDETIRCNKDCSTEEQRAICRYMRSFRKVIPKPPRKRTEDPHANKSQQMDPAALGCAFSKKRPWIGVYHSCPGFRPFCLSTQKLLIDFISLSLLLMAAVVWNPFIILVYSFRAIMLCVL